MSVFEAVADHYEEYRKPRPEVIQHLIETINEHSLSNGNIIEFGCGPGGYANEVGRFFKKKILGIDLSVSMLENANNKPYVSATIGDCNKLHCLGEQPFNFAYCVNFIHYVNCLNSFFRKLNNSIVKNGVIYLATHSKDDLLRQTIGKYFPSAIDVELPMIHSVEKILKSLHENGFRDLKVESIVKSYPMKIKDLDAYRFKTYNCLHFIDKDLFSDGLVKMENDINTGVANSTISYTVIKGVKYD